MKPALMMIAVAISSLFLGGCATTGMSDAFDKDGLPKQQYYVGGGFMLNYRAPERGILYVVEANSQKIIVTESLSKLQVYNADINPQDKDVHMRLKAVGVDPLNLNFKMYFVPEHQGTEEVSDE